jgi:hypothetical protein
MRIFSKFLRRFLLFLVVAVIPAAAASPTDLPRVLLIGDSISGGYQKEVKRLLEGKAVVVKNPGNAEYTGTGLKKLHEWLGDEKWDVIHFNWGLWDMYGQEAKCCFLGRRLAGTPTGVQIFRGVWIGGVTPLNHRLTDVMPLASVFEDAAASLNDSTQTKCSGLQLAWSFDPGGIRAVSRWLSEATPPVEIPNKIASRRDARRLST